MQAEAEEEHTETLVQNLAALEALAEEAVEKELAVVQHLVQLILEEAEVDQEVIVAVVEQRQDQREDLDLL
jgi:hypothetical protein